VAERPKEAKHFIRLEARLAACLLVLVVLADGCSARERGPQSGPEISGDCNAKGSGNTVNCNRPLPDKIGNVEVSGFLGKVFLFDGPPSSLPRPPAYPRSEAIDHCDIWEKWLLERKDVYTLVPGGEVHAVSGKDEQVAIVGYEVELYDRKPIRKKKVTYLACHYGGGDTWAYQLNWDTRTSKATLTDLVQDDAKSVSMPPASVNLVGPSYNGVLLTVTSNAGYLYSGRILVTAVINGERKQLAIGSRDNPHRWVGGDNPYDNYKATWDWNPVKKAWEKDFDPFSL
jgi:hypothetical protein